MGGYDLYGRYYRSQADAENAEMAQCANISMGLQSEENNRLWNEIGRLVDVVQNLESRIQYLEKGQSNDH